MSESGAAAAGGALHELCRADPVWAERYSGWTELGHGGAATVVRTHSRAAGRDVALKVFLRTAAEDWPRFQAEVRNAQALASPFIVQTYSPFQGRQIAWIEMELVEGQDLEHALARRDGRPFSLPEVLEVGVSVARALATAHEAGVLHRDVKPANILLPEKGRPGAKLGDFGTSRLADTARLTHTGLLAGTPQFVAPEVVAGESGGPAADVYGLGLCLYLMVSGNRFPFRMSAEAPVAQWLKAHLDAPALPVTAFNGEVPRFLVDLLARGLAKDPSHRPRAADIVAALERGTFTTAPEPRPLGSTRAWVGGGSLLLMLVLGAALLTRHRGPSPVAAEASPVPRVSPSAQPTPGPTPKQASSTPPARSPRVTALPTPAANPPVARPLRASIRGELMTLLNTSEQPLLDLQIVLIDATGMRHHASALEGVAPGEELHLALDDFAPPVDAAALPARLEVGARDPHRNRAQTFVLRLR